MLINQLYGLPNFALRSMMSSPSESLSAVQTHPWSIVDDETGALVKEVVAEAGSQSIPIQEPEGLALRLDHRSQEEPQPTAAFDGVGGSSESYAPAQVSPKLLQANLHRQSLSLDAKHL